MSNMMTVETVTRAVEQAVRKRRGCSNTLVEGEADARAAFHILQGLQRQFHS
jgi:hypothetical protein